MNYLFILMMTLSAHSFAQYEIPNNFKAKRKTSLQQAIQVLKEINVTLKKAQKNKKLKSVDLDKIKLIESKIKTLSESIGAEN